MNIGNRIEKTRKTRGINQQELSDKIGKSRTMISKIEKGNSIPTLDTIEILCKELKVSADYLIFGIEGSNNKNESELLELYRNLNNEYQVVAKYKIKELIKEQSEETVYEKVGNSL